MHHEFVWDGISFQGIAPNKLTNKSLAYRFVGWRNNALTNFFAIYKVMSIRSEDPGHNTYRDKIMPYGFLVNRCNWKFDLNK